MKKKVTIADDTGRRTVIRVVTPGMRRDAAIAGDPIDPRATFLYVVDGQGRKLQETVVRRVTYEGAHLHNAVKRAKRWLRANRMGSATPPRHIKHALAAFAAADRKGFDAALGRASA